MATISMRKYSHPKTVYYETDQYLKMKQTEMKQTSG